MIGNFSLFTVAMLAFMVVPGPAAAAFITVTFTGQVTSIDPVYDGALSYASAVDGTIAYDNGSITGVGDEGVFLGEDPAASLVLNLGPYSFGKTDDFEYALGYPAVFYLDGTLLGLDLIVYHAERVGWLLRVDGDRFGIFGDPASGSPLVEGRLAYVTPVPLPAAGWLLLAGGAFLAGMGRFRRPQPA